MKQKCAVSGVEFEIDERDQRFYERLDFDPPQLCPEERCRRRLAWQNMSYLYRRRCAATGKSVISNISEDKPFPVYDQAYWWSDAWDFRSFGRPFDFSKTFFENFAELLNVVPHPNVATSHLLDENSDYTNFAGGNKNCYLIFHADMNRDCMYGVGVKKCTNVVDGLHVHGSELLYEAVDCRGCYSLAYCEDCENCSNSWFLKNCIGCRNCFGCMNLRHKEYCIGNVQVSPEAYASHLAAFQSGKHSEIEKALQNFSVFCQTQPHRGVQGYQNEGTTGDNVFRCKDVLDSFDVQESRDMRYCHRVYNGPNSDCFDVNEYGMQIQRVCEGLAIGINAYNVLAGVFVNEQVTDIAYSVHVHHSRNIFGCIGAVRAEYCILNMQYTKDEYEVLRRKIVTHMRETGEYGNFFPLELSPFGYNETTAMEYFPLTEDEVLARGWKWKAPESSDFLPQNYRIPDDIADVDDSILNQVLACQKSGRNFKVQKMELEFLRQMKLPIPRVCYHERHAARFAGRNPRRLFPRPCGTCGQESQTTYPPSRAETVLCEHCYEATVA